MLQNSLQRPRRLSGAEDGEKTYPNRGSKAYEEAGNMEFDSVSRETCTCGEYTSMPRGICLVCIVELHKLSRNKKKTSESRVEPRRRTDEPWQPGAFAAGLHVDVRKHQDLRGGGTVGSQNVQEYDATTTTTMTRDVSRSSWKHLDSAFGSVARASLSGLLGSNSEASQGPVRCLLGAVWGALGNFWGCSGASWGLLGASWVRSGRFLERPGSLLGTRPRKVRSDAPSGISLGPKIRSDSPSGVSLGPTWRPLELFWGPLGLSWSCLGGLLGCIEAIKKPLGLSLSVRKPKSREPINHSKTLAKPTILALGSFLGKLLEASWGVLEAY